MIDISLGVRVRLILFFVSAGAIATPALADHIGPGGVAGGGGLSVVGPDTLDAGHWAAGLRILYTRPEQRSDAELDSLTAAGVDAHNSNDTLNAAAGVAYGVSHHLTISAELPYVRRDRLREGTLEGVEPLGTVSGIGDASVLAKYRLTEGDGAGFSVIAGVKLPTGSTNRRSAGGERLETEHQPGSGSWDPVIGASAGVKAGPVRLTASAIYQVSTPGAQRTRLGNRLQGGIALSHRFGAEPDHHTESHSLNHGDELDERGEHAHASWDAFIELAGEWEGRQRIAGEAEPASGGKWVYVAPGVRFIAASGWSVGAGVALPVWQRIRASHPEQRYRLMLSFGRAL